MKRRLNRLRLWLIAELTTEKEQLLIRNAVQESIIKYKQSNAYKLGFGVDEANDRIKILNKYIEKFNKYTW